MKICITLFSSVHSLSHVWLYVTPWTTTLQASLSITNSRSLLKLMSIESMMPYSHLILILLSIFPRPRISSNDLALHFRRPKYWSYSFNISPSNEHPGTIFFRMDWLDLLAVQGTLKSLLQHHSSKASILWHSAFFTVQLSHPYTTTGKTIALTRWTLVGKVMSLLLNMLSRLVITFLPRSKRLLISWLQWPSAGEVVTCNQIQISVCFPGRSVVKNLPANAGDEGSVPRSGRFPGGGNGHPLQCSYLENPMDRGTWQATAHRVTKSWTWLSMYAQII